MRVLAIFVLVQIAGILGGPINPDQTPNDELTKMEVVRNIVLQGDFWISYFGLRHAKFVENSTTGNKIEWNLHEGTDADNATIQEAEAFLNSVMELSNITDHRFRAAFNASHGGLNSTIETACDWFTTANSLLRNLASSLKSYWLPGESATADLVLNIANEMLYYVCQNNGTHISAFLAADGEVCVTSSGAEVQSCGRTSFSSNTSVIGDHRPVNIPWHFPTITLNSQACREFGAFQKCTVGALERCQKPTPSVHVNSLFNIVKKSSGCEDLLEA